MHKASKGLQGIFSQVRLLENLFIRMHMLIGSKVTILCYV